MSRAPGRRSWTRLAPVVAAAVVLAGCASSGSGSSSAPLAPPGSSGSFGTAASDASPTGTEPAAGAAVARPSPGCASTPPGTIDPQAPRTLHVGGVDRTHLVATPATAGPAPLIVLLHGMGSSAADIDRVSDLPARGTAAGAIVVTPDAVGSPTMWRAGGQGPDADYLDALIADVEARHCVDTGRIGIAGFSVGAVFAAAYACTHQDRIAAIVTVEVDAPGPCTKPLPILAFHGTADPIVPYAPPAGSPALGGGTGTEANLATWASFSRCASTPTTTEVGSEVTKLEWPGCEAGSEVVLYKIIGGQHDWPGKDPATAVHPSTQQVSATDEAIRFFTRHRLAPDAAASPAVPGTVPATATASRSSAGCRAATPVAPGTTDRTVSSGGEPRSYQLIVPAGYDGTKPLPIVFGLHPDVISYTIIPPMIGFPDMAKTRDFIGVSPSGLRNGTIPYWMAVRTEPPGRDITFFSDLLDQLEAELCVDPGRVYATGMANGAQMASLLACQLGDRITAVAPLAGPEWPKECDGRPVPVMAFHGDKDPFVSYQDGRGDAKEVADKNLWKGNVPPGLPVHEGAEQAMANWAAHNGCDAEPVVEQISKDVERSTWQHCEAETVFFHIIGGGHTWPSRPVPAFEKTFGYTTMDIDATQLMFDFFDAQERGA